MGFPRGAMELGESVLDCCVREVREETGLEVVRALPVSIYSDPRYTYTDPWGNQRQMVVVVFLVREWTGELRSETNETTDCRFFPMDGLPDLPPLYAETVEDIRSFDGTLIMK